MRLPRPKVIQRDLDRELKEAQLRLAQKQEAGSLWLRPAIADVDMPTAIDLPRSTWQWLKGRGDAPPRFRIGRRVYCRTADVLAWIASRPASTDAADSDADHPEDDDEQHHAHASSAHALLHPHSAAPHR